MKPKINISIVRGTHLILGFKHEDDLNLQFDEQHINLRQLLIAIGNDTRFSIIEALFEKGELTASSIAKRLGVPSTTVLRHIEILYNCGAIYISRKSGLQIFYKINYHLLKSANKLITKKLGGKTNKEAGIN